MIYREARPSRLDLAFSKDSTAHLPQPTRSAGEGRRRQETGQGRIRGKTIGLHGTQSTRTTRISTDFIVRAHPCSPCTPRSIFSVPIRVLRVLRVLCNPHPID